MYDSILEIYQAAVTNVGISMDYSLTLTESLQSLLNNQLQIVTTDIFPRKSNLEQYFKTIQFSQNTKDYILNSADQFDIYPTFAGFFKNLSI